MAERRLFSLKRFFSTFKSLLPGHYTCQKGSILHKLPRLIVSSLRSRWFRLKSREDKRTQRLHHSPEMEVSELISDDLNHRVMAAVKAAEARGAPPLIQAAEAARCARESGSSFPNLDLGLALVSNLCFDHNIPSLWKLLHQAMASRAVSSFHTLALLTAR